jgi:hypothetical protein
VSALKRPPCGQKKPGGFGLPVLVIVLSISSVAY